MTDNKPNQSGYFSDLWTEATVLVDVMYMPPAQLQIFMNLIKDWHFNYPETQKVYAYLKWAWKQEAADLMDETLYRYYTEQTGTAIDLEDFAALVTKASALPKSENLMVYIQSLEDRARASYAFNKLSKPGTASDFLKTLATVANKALSGNIRTKIKTASTECLAICKEIVEDTPPPEAGPPSGFWILDTKTHGWHWDALNVLAARAGIGKTNLALQFGSAAVTAGADVLFLSLEMETRTIIHRIISQQAEILMGDVERNGRGTTKMGTIALTAEKVQEHWEIRDDVPHDILGVEASIRIELEARKFGLIIVDHLQEIAFSNNRTITRHLQVSAICDRLKSIGREYQVPILVLSQLVRDTQNKGRPRLSHLKESGSTEEKAGIVMLLHRPDRHKPEAELILAKNRYGDTGFLRLWFDKGIVKFIERTNDNGRE